MLNLLSPGSITVSIAPQLLGVEGTPLPSFPSLQSANWLDSLTGYVKTTAAVRSSWQWRQVRKTALIWVIQTFAFFYFYFPSSSMAHDPWGGDDIDAPFVADHSINALCFVTSFKFLH